MKKNIINICLNLLTNNIKEILVFFLISILIVGFLIGLLFLSFIKLIVITTIIIIEKKLEDLIMSDISKGLFILILIVLMIGILLGIIAKLLIMI